MFAKFLIITIFLYIFPLGDEEEGDEELDEGDEELGEEEGDEGAAEGEGEGGEEEEKAWTNHQNWEGCKTYTERALNVQCHYSIAVILSWIFGPLWDTVTLVLFRNQVCIVNMYVMVYKSIERRVNYFRAGIALSAEPVNAK